METENLIESDEKEYMNGMVDLVEESYENGLSSYRIRINPEFVQECYTYDQAWDEEYKKFIAHDYPYTMSPETTRLIAMVSTELKEKMHDAGFELEHWLKLSENEPYVMGVLRRVMVTDTIEPIIGYTDEMANHLSKLKSKSPDKLLHIRSFFSGASVADKCLIARLYQMGVSANLLATDLSADSVAVGALNLEVWNQMLPEQDRYEIHMIHGDVPKELSNRENTIIFQVGDAITTSQTDSSNSTKFDALLIDNGLQYIDRNSTKEIVSNVLQNKGEDGLYIGTLGLDSDIRVSLSPVVHGAEILKAYLGKNLSKEYSKKYFPHTPYNYPHRYSFSVGEENQILITKVISDGAARMYSWLAHLLKTNRALFGEVMKAIKSATDLSKVSIEVETSPFDYHQAILDAIDSNHMVASILEKPLNYEDFGWTKIEGERDMYSKGKEKVDGGTMVRICKQIDPIVLRRSRIFVE